MWNVCMRHATHMNESCPTYERVMSHIWTSHFPHMNESCPTYDRFMSHIWTTHDLYTTRAWSASAALMKESWQTYQWVTSAIRSNHDTHTNKSARKYHALVSSTNIPMSHVSHMIKLWHSYEQISSHTYHVLVSSSAGWVMSHKPMSHVTHINESCPTHGRVTSHIPRAHGTSQQLFAFAFEIWLFHFEPQSQEHFLKFFRLIVHHW